MYQTMLSPSLYPFSYKNKSYNCISFLFLHFAYKSPQCLFPNLLRNFLLVIIASISKRSAWERSRTKDSMSSASTSAGAISVRTTILGLGVLSIDGVTALAVNIETDKDSRKVIKFFMFRIIRNYDHNLLCIIANIHMLLYSQKRCDKQVWFLSQIYTN